MRLQVGVIDDRESDLVGQQAAVGAKIKAPRLMPEVEAAVKAMFTRTGYRLTTNAEAEAEADVKVRLRGTRFDYTMGWWTGGQHVSASLSVTARKDGGEYENTYRSEAERRRFVVAFGEEIDDLFNRHLAEVIRQIANDQELHHFLTK